MTVKRITPVDKFFAKLGELTFAAIALPALMAPPLLLRAWVATMLWAWYVIPFFHAPVLPIVYAFGFLLIASFAVGRGNTDQDKMFWVRVYVFPFVTLALGWIGTFWL